MKKGFTLIELLAVIIVLAALAAIVVPVTTGIIKESKEKTKQASIELYAKTAKQAILEYELENKVSPKSFEDIELYIEYDGNEVSCETKILYGDKSIYLDKCSVNGKLAEDYSVGKKICTLVSGSEDEIGSMYECEVSYGVKHNFYVLSKDKDGTAYLIMERNICDDGTVATAENKCTVAWQSNGSNTSGPVTAMDYLYDATKDWSNIPNIEIDYTDEGNTGSYGYGTIKTTNNITKITKRDGTPIKVLVDQEGYTNLKARLPKYEEVHGTGKCLKNIENGGKGGSCPLWLVNYLRNSSEVAFEGIQNIDGIYGYWTFYSVAEYPSMAWYVNYDGIFGAYLVSFSTNYGVRPVINIKL